MALTAEGLQEVCGARFTRHAACVELEGTVLEIAVGSIGSIALPELHLRRNLDRLSGFRCIHTHPGGEARLSDVDLQALRLLRFDSMCAVGVKDGPYRRRCSKAS